MTLNELYVLNSAIDGQDIYSIPAFSKNKLSQMSIDLIKDSMIEKGYLDNINTLTSQGATQVRRIEQFKNAFKYITILNLVIGCIDEEKGILLRLNNESGYQFSPISIKEVINTLAEVFPDLLGDNDNEQEDEKNITCKYVNPRQLLIDYPVKAETSFTLKIFYKNNTCANTNELFFESNRKKYYYDCDNHILREKSFKDLRDIICERIGGSADDVGI